MGQRLGGEHGGHRRARSETAPPSSSGTPSIVSAELAAWASSSAGAAHVGVGVGRRRTQAARARSRASISWSICCSSVGVRSKRSRGVALVRRAGRPSAAGGRERAAGGAGGAEAVARRAVEQALGAVAHAQAVEDVGGGEGADRSQSERYAARAGRHDPHHICLRLQTRRLVSLPSADRLRGPNAAARSPPAHRGARRLRRRRPGAGPAGAGAHGHRDRDAGARRRPSRPSRPGRPAAARRSSPR